MFYDLHRIHYLPQTVHSDISKKIPVKKMLIETGKKSIFDLEKQLYKMMGSDAESFVDCSRRNALFFLLIGSIYNKNDSYIYLYRISKKKKKN
jgi:hypothetical protein